VLDTIPVLLYHSVPREDERGDRLSVPYELFCGHMDAVVASQRVPVSVSQLANGLRGRTRLPERSVAITFDDGFENNLRAIEALATRGLRATLYLTTGKSGSAQLLTPRQIEVLAHGTDYVEIGAHSVSHPYLDELEPMEVWAEVTHSKQYLEHLLGWPIRSFAYPYGAYSSLVREVVVAAGFQSAAAVKNALSHSADDPFAIARWTVGRGTSVQKLDEVLCGRGARHAWSGERLRTRGYRGARRVRRRVIGAGGGIAADARDEARA
jgi:peptidoglycan/xylan/chitin deacetylase (PgdA/CDA1 family)